MELDRGRRRVPVSHVYTCCFLWSHRKAFFCWDRRILNPLPSSMNTNERNVGSSEEQLLLISRTRNSSQTSNVALNIILAVSDYSSLKMLHGREMDYDQ
ncbi:hypothetical protein Mapa_003034 [Marchantia paleacea]|nr:hypothetical protein Mapa_003034 [Marchantia paleacea]